MAADGAAGADRAVDEANEDPAAARRRSLEGSPELELLRYAVDLRSITAGTGRFTRRYLRHDPMPEQEARKVLAGP